MSFLIIFVKLLFLIESIFILNLKFQHSYIVCHLNLITMSKVKNLFKIPILMFKVFGFAVSYERNFKGVLMKLYAMFTFFYLISFGTLLHIVYMLEDRKSVEDFVEASSTTLTAFESMSKFCLVYFYRKEIKNLIAMFDEFVSRGKKLFINYVMLEGGGRSRNFYDCMAESYKFRYEGGLIFLDFCVT